MACVNCKRQRTSCIERLKQELFFPFCLVTLHLQRRFCLFSTFIVPLAKGATLCLQYLWISSNKDKRERIVIMTSTYKTLTESFNRCLVLRFQIHFILLCVIAHAILSKSLRYPWCWPKGLQAPGKDWFLRILRKNKRYFINFRPVFLFYLV